MRFLRDWAEDWGRGVWMKVVVSQTIFCNLATLPPPANTDAVTPKLPVEPVGGYAAGELKVADHDSNGWPQGPRNEALRAMRSCLAFHIAGDQHLGSTVQYGIENWNDASWAVCVPAIANIFPRRWYPQEPGRNPKAHSPRNTGEYLDGFGNKITVHAVFNPQAVDFEPKPLNRRAPGYGIIEFDRAARSITVTNWPRWVDAAKTGAKPCEGWPITIRQTDNGLPASGWVLDPIEQPAIIQVATAGGQTIYTLRSAGRFTPAVPGEGVYSVRILDDSGKVITERRNVKAKKA